MKRNYFVPLGAAALLLVLSLQDLQAEDALSSSAPVGHSGTALVTPVNQVVRSAGTLLELPGMRPQAIALSPDGKLLVTAGLTHEIVTIDPVTAKIRQHVSLPSDQAKEEAPVSTEILSPDGRAQLSFTGLAFSPDGSRIYMANVNGDIKVFSVDKDSNVAPLFSIALPPANAPLRDEEIPAGIAVSADGKKLYVALNLSNRLVELDAASGKVLRTWNVGVAPYDVVLTGQKIYVSNWGGRRPATDSVTGPAGRGTLVRVDQHSVASEGSVAVIDLATTNQTEILTGKHACAMALSPNGRYLVVANATSDTLSVLDTRSDKIVETICARQNEADLFGAQPDALAFDKSGKKLFVCNGTQNAVAVFQFHPGHSQLLGLIPVGWFPGAIAYDAARKQICVANIKNLATEKEKPRPNLGRVPGFNTKEYAGSLSIVPVPSSKKLATYTQTAREGMRYPLIAQSRLPARANQMPVPLPERIGEPSVFQHVIYIIKENRSYDQVLGDETNGNGNADLCVFGTQVTPNQHKFTEDFVLLDNTYCCSVLSADGHQWADTGIATDYMEREFAGFPRSYPAGGAGMDGKDALAYSPAGFIWNDAFEHGRTVTDFGEFASSTCGWKDSSHKGKPHFLDYYHGFLNGLTNIDISCEPDLEAIRPFLVTNTVGWDLDVPDQVRSAVFRSALKDFEAAGSLPNLTIIWLPDDHTSGAKAGSPKPVAQVADNDLAFGQIVDAVSHSSFWTNTCIFAIEDDPQNGWDHVSGYRTTAYVVSPYTKRHTVVSTQYNQTSLLRTMELMLGLPPMNQMDATATPMSDCFTNTPDFTAYTAQTNNIPLDEMNAPSRKINDAQLRTDEMVSSKLPLLEADKCPEDVLNRILWRSVMGKKPYPEWAVKVVTDDD